MVRTLLGKLAMHVFPGAGKACLFDGYAWKAVKLVFHLLEFQRPSVDKCPACTTRK